MMVNVVGVFLIIQTLHASAAWYGGLEAVMMIRPSPAACWPAAGSRTDAGRARAVVGGAALMSLALLGFERRTGGVCVLVPLGLVVGAGNGMVNVCVATLVMYPHRRADPGPGGGGARGAAQGGLGGVAGDGGALAAVLIPGRSSCWRAGWAPWSRPSRR